jgi:hypothetical protein
MIDPCDTTVITNPTLTTITVTNGQTSFITFPEAVDSVETANNLGNLCGPRAYGIYENDNGGNKQVVSWGVTVTAHSVAGQYKITAAPVDDGTEGTKSVFLRITLTSQPNH